MQQYCHSPQLVYGLQEKSWQAKGAVKTLKEKHKISYKYMHENE